MKKTAIVVAALALFACATGALLAQSPEDAKFKKFQDTLLGRLFQVLPDGRDPPGLHEVQRQAREPERRRPRQVQRGPRRLQPGARVQDRQDRSSPRTTRSSTRCCSTSSTSSSSSSSTSCPGTTTPFSITTCSSSRLRSLLVKNGGAGVAPATARAKLIPGLVKVAKDSLKNPPQEYTQAAIDQMPAIIDFYRVEHPQALRRRRRPPGRGRQGRRRPRGLPAVPEGRAPGQVDRQLPDARLRTSGSSR